MMEMHKWDQMKTITTGPIFQISKMVKMPYMKSSHERQQNYKSRPYSFFVSIFTNQSHAIGYSWIILVVGEFFIIISCLNFEWKYPYW